MLKKAETTSGLYTLSAGKIALLEVPLPPLEQQQRIVAVLTERMAAAEQLGKTLEEELDAITKMPAALLRQAFSGDLN